MAIDLTPAYLPLFPGIKSLYEDSFPVQEKRPWPQQEILIAQNKLLVLQIESSAEFVGFLTYWQLRACIFIEHFALTPDTRGKGIGASVMQKMADKFDTIILECEPAAVSVEAKRRLAFYQRLGYQQYAFAYQQPPYQPDQLPQKMELLYRVQPLKQPPLFETLCNEIYRTIYNAVS